MTDQEEPEGPATEVRLTDDQERAFAAAKVEKAIELLRIDPRTSELAEMVPGLMAVAAMQSGATGEAASLKPAELADVFQAVYDAWGAAEVHVSDDRFRFASQLAGGAQPTQVPA
jgi:hypothetical protein